MKKFGFAVGIIAVVVLGMVVAAKAEGIKEGKWTMTIVTRMPGIANEEAVGMKEEMDNMSPQDKALMQNVMGGMINKANANDAGMTTTTTQCITNSNPVPDMNRSEDCKVDHSFVDGTVNFEVTCPDGTSMGKVTYKEDSMKGIIKSHSDKGDVDIEISGEYQGPCEEKSNK